GARGRAIWRAVSARRSAARRGAAGAAPDGHPLIVVKILYLGPDIGVPVLGRKGASVHVRELVAAFGRAGHNVVLAAQVLNKSPWEKPASIDANLIHVRASSHIAGVAAALKALNAMLGSENSLPGELRRILYNQELTDDVNC